MFAFNNPIDTRHYLFVNISDDSCISSGLNDEQLPDLTSLCINEIFFDETAELAVFDRDRFCASRSALRDDLPGYGDAWNLDILDHNTNGRYEFHNGAVTGRDIFDTDEMIDIYVMDTGIRATHNEFDQHYDNQVEVLGNCYETQVNQHTHGTSISALAGGYNFGASRGQHIFDVQVCSTNGGCSSTCAIEKMADIRDKIVSRKRRGVINMSYGGFNGASTQALYNLALQDIINVGGIPVAAAGNDAKNDCRWPGKSPHAIAVGNHDKNLKVFHKSNYGSCVDVYAGGTNVVTASNEADNKYHAIWGTSASSPIVAGIIVNWLIECELYNYHEPCTMDNVSNTVIIWFSVFFFVLFVFADHKCFKTPNINCFKISSSLHLFVVVFFVT